MYKVQESIKKTKREPKEVLGCVLKGYVWRENRMETGRVEDTREGNRGVSAKKHIGNAIVILTTLHADLKVLEK